MQDIHYFTILKTSVLRKFCEANPHWQRPLSEFGVREIARFQELMQEQAGGRISEKWFYTHLKKDQEKLPRVDVLDLLSRYAGHADWAAFKDAQTPQPAEEAPAIAPGNKLVPRHWGRVAALFGIGALAVFTLFISLSSLRATVEKTYEACFTDAMTKQPLTGMDIQLELQGAGESPTVEMARPDGCHTFRTPADQVVFTVKAPYYHPDTITRSLKTGHLKETIPLRRDDYAWMIHLFSSGKVADWKKRREQLGQMIADDAVILQVDPATGAGVELYNKTDFISKLTLPVSSLKNLRVLETIYEPSGQIQKMRFAQD
jgi:hypothetical protein